ncbi:hypothetical protein [Chryseobacterium sp.]|uniref:hypothetical protein n=1 Tax=Chryseobacterium sp. TaxID=1871047 RepID=UPI0011CC794B|nr:hypothetical protein [Chryseobacterium sp.]TXF79549.1 hypothetical protein FUA25_03970 [Chryseobacterium sp.]
MDREKKYKNLELILGGFFNFIGAVLLTLLFLSYYPDIAFIAPLFFLSSIGKLRFQDFNFRNFKEEINDIRNLKKNSAKD